jgi:hypothetical protein
MKKILITITYITVLFLSSCSTDTTGVVSSITYYADINIIGDTEIIINQGDPYTDPSADVILNEAPYPFETVGDNIDTDVPGVYYITYSAVNAEGFAASATRTVVVISTAPSIYNLAGAWARSTGSPGTCVQLSDRYYTYENAGGFGTGTDDQLNITFINVNDEEIYIPYQVGSASGITVVSYQPGNIEDNNNISWSLSASGVYGTFTRFFSRQ